MKKLPLISDVLFYSVSAGFLTLAILRYYRVALGVAFTVAVLVTLAVGLFVFLLLRYRSDRRALTKKAQEERDALMLHLTLERQEKVRAAFVTALCADGKEAGCERDYLRADGELMIPYFTMQPVSADAVALLLRELGTEPFTLLCNALSPEAEKLLTSFGKKAIRCDEVYSLFARTNTMPDPLICGEIPRRTVKQKLHRTFGKRNARPFFVSGLLLLFMSLFTFFPIYYLVTGSILLVCAVSVRFFGYA